MTRKRGPFVIGILTCLFFLITVSSAQEIPAGVNYKKTTNEINDKAKRILEKALAETPDNIDLNKTFASAISCGPLIWDAIKDIGGDKFKGASKLVLIINSSNPITKEGRGISTPEHKRLFWKLFLEKIKGNRAFSIRKAKANEISYYWATIPFDIEEPFFILDFDKTSVLIHFAMKDGEPRIFWMDIVGDLKTLK